MYVSGSGSRARGVFATICAIVCAISVSTACAAGQQSQTAHEKPTLDGINGGVGQIKVLGVAFRSPSGPSYPKGASVPLTAYIANDSEAPDKLVKVSSPAFSGGWGVAPSSSSSGVSGGSSTPQTIQPGSAVGFGLQNLTPSGGGSSHTLVLHGLSTQLWPGMSVKVTFSFAQAGDATLVVPVQLSDTPNTRTLPSGPGTPTAG